MTNLLNRRIFLRGLGGAAVAAPFLGSVAERAARAQSTPVGVPKRLIVMFTHYGCLTTRWFPTKSHGALTADDLTGTTLAPLAPFAGKLLMPRGVRAMNEWHATGRRGQGNDPHTQVVGSYFTCQPVTPNTDDPFDFNQATKFNAKPIGPSLDHVCASQLSPSGTPLFMRVSGANDSGQSAISYSSAETAFPGFGSASQVFSHLTGLFQDGAPMTPDSYRALRGQSVLDLVKDDLETLERFDMSRSDREKLAAWKELIDSTGTIVASEQCNQATAAALGLSSETVNAVRGGLGSDILTTKVGDTMDGADVFSALAVLSAICDANRVIFLKYPGNYVFRGLGIDLENHSASHRIGDAGMGGACVPGILETLQKIDDFYAKKFAYLVHLLNEVDESGGKLLDNTATVWLQEMSDGNAHNLNNLPILQAGSCGGYFKTGQIVNVHDGSADMTRGNSELFCKDGNDDIGFGDIDSTGTAPSVGSAPINKYYCNLMNAIGVKAGPDGFPLKGGSAEVTHFGMYDDTTDFVGGGTKPPRITNPGGFDGLRANT